MPPTSRPSDSTTGPAINIGAYPIGHPDETLRFTLNVPHHHPVTSKRQPLRLDRIVKDVTERRRSAQKCELRPGRGESSGLEKCRVSAENIQPLTSDRAGRLRRSAKNRIAAVAQGNPQLVTFPKTASCLSEAGDSVKRLEHIVFLQGIPF